MDLTAIAKNAIEQAIAGKSKLNKEALAVDGMSSIKSRHMLNNLCDFPGAVYLEIGSWKGSTIIAASYNNKGDFYAIDSFQKRFKQKESPAIDFYANQKKFKGRADYEFFEGDSWEFDKSKIDKKVNVYFYDGDHSPEGTEKAFLYYHEVFADQFIMVMDDWNRGHIRQSTKKALENYTILYERELYTPGKKNDPHGEDGLGSMKNRTIDTWWNGLYVAVIQK